MTNHWIDIKNADVILIMGSNAADTGTLLNHTLDMILAICRPDSFKILMGPTTPFSPILFDYGIDALCGTVVEDEDLVCDCISRHLPFKKLKGIRRICWVKS